MSLEMKGARNYAAERRANKNPFAEIGRHKALERTELTRLVTRHDIHAVNDIARDPSLVQDPETRKEGVREAVDVYIDIISHVGLPPENVGQALIALAKNLKTRPDEGEVVIMQTVHSVSEGK